MNTILDAAMEPTRIVRLDTRATKRRGEGFNVRIKLIAAMCSLLVVGGLALSPRGAAASAGGSVLTAGQSLMPGQSLHSPDGQFTLVLQQSDGNLVLYDPVGKPLWSSGTSNRGAALAIMQTDGNFVIYNNSSVPLWNTVTWGHPGASLALQTDANLVVYAPNNGGALWATYVLKHTRTSLNYCTSWQELGINVATECLGANDWYDGAWAATNWNVDTCSTIVGPYFCAANQNIGHYWNSSIGANTDYVHRVIEVYLVWRIDYGCINLNINTKPDGSTWSTSSVYAIIPQNILNPTC
jgi:hypothetical protein